MRTKKHIFEGSLTARSGSLADNCIGNENLVEPGYNSEDDKHVICNDNDSTPLPNKSSDNVEDIILLQILTTTKATMISFTNLNQSSQIARWVRLLSRRHVGWSKAAKPEILQSNKNRKRKCDRRF